MQVFTEIEQLCSQFANTVIALGTFDGVHIGHQKIIGRAVQLAREHNGTSVVFTFSNHPLSVIAPKRCPLQINTQTDKEKLIACLGVDVLISIPFTAEFLRLSPQEFVQLLADKLAPVCVVAGPNYSFGYKSAGKPDLLRQLGDKYGFAVEILEAVVIDGKIISSTYIRQLISCGDITAAKKYLGRPPFITGKVVAGDARGRLLGYPTANITIDKSLVIPSDGVYAASVEMEGLFFNALANIGNNPTFSISERRLEVYLLNFDGDLYDKEITVHFLGRIRDEITFTSAAALTRQIAQDISKAQTMYFS